MGKPHDTLFAFTFGKAEHASSLLRGLLTGPAGELFAGSGLRSVPTRTTGAALRLHDGDILFILDLADHPAPVFVLIEHKAYREPRLLRQVHRQVVHLTETWTETHGAVPHILSVVVHHGRRPMAPLTWRPPAALRRAHPALRTCDPQLHVICIDLNQFSEADLRRLVPEPLPCLTLLCLRNLPHQNNLAVTEALVRMADLLRAVEAGDGGPQAMEVITSYILCVSNLPADQLSALLTRILNKPTESYVMSTGHRLRQEGKAEGKVEESQRLLLTLLAARFGNVPLDIEGRVRRATRQDLDEWWMRLLNAKSLPAVFAAE